MGLRIYWMLQKNYLKCSAGTIGRDMCRRRNTDQMAQMYDTDEPVKVQLLCHVSVMKYLIDNFGKEFETKVVNEDQFLATVSVCTSSTFYWWIFGFCDKIRIIEPEIVVIAYRKMLESAIDKHK